MSTTEVAVRRPTEERASRGRPVLAVARVEAVRLVRHPAFLVGLAGTIAGQPLGRAENWGGQSYYTSMTGWTFLWVGTLVAGALVAGRQRIVGDTEVFPATPVTRRDRALGTVLALAGPALVATAAAVTFALAVGAGGGFTQGDGAWARKIQPHPFEWVQPVLLVVLAGVVGVTLAQLRRGRLTAVLVAALFTFFGGTFIWAFQTHPFRVLHPFMFGTYELGLPRSFSPVDWGPDSPPLIPPGEFHATWHSVLTDTAALGWHLVYVGGLVLVGVWVAAWLAGREERAAPIRRLLLVGLPFLLVGGVAQLVTAATP